MDQRIICIIAGQRAGTTALQHVIARSGAATNYGEIFQSNLQSKKGRTFHEFAQQNNIAFADMMLVKQARPITERYINWLKEGAKPKHVLIDVKLNSWLALSPAWQYPHEQPFFLTQLRRERAVFIFIWRESLADQVLSSLISQDLGIWHNLDPEQVAGRKIEAPINRLKRLASLICQAEANMKKHLLNYSEKIVIRYEDLYKDGELVEEFTTAFRALVGVELGQVRLTGIRPNSVSKRDIIRNYDEAVVAIDAIAAKYRTGKTEREVTTDD